MSKLRNPKTAVGKESLKKTHLKEFKGKVTFSKKLRKRGTRRKKRAVSGKKQLGTPQRKSEELVKYEQVTDAVKALLLLCEKTTDADSKLFGDSPQPIMMQVVAAKVPDVPSKRLRFKLPNPLITDNTDVCLIVNTWPRSLKGNIELIIEYYKERLKKKGISQISQVMLLKQLNTEYSEFEQKRRICQQFDIFLSDVRIGDMVACYFGKFLKYSTKTPIPVDLRVDNLKEEIENALSKTTMQIHGKGDSFIVQVGHTKQHVKEVVENMCTVFTGLAKEFPGEWENVSAVYIKTADSLAIPVYVSLKSPNEVPIPRVKRIKPKNAVPVEGELATKFGYIAKVFPDGRVKLKRDMDVVLSDDEEMTVMRNSGKKASSKLVKEKRRMDEDESDCKTRKKAKTGKLDAKEKGDDELEKDVVIAEESYLQQWERKRNQELEEKKKNIQGEVSELPRKKKVSYVIGEMSLGNLRSKPTNKGMKARSGGIVHTAFEELKSKISNKKMARKQKMAMGNKSVTCSKNKSGKQKKRNARGKKSKSSG